MTRNVSLLLMMLAGFPMYSGESFKASVFPLEFMRGETYTIAENLPAVLCVNTWAVNDEAKKRLGAKRPVLILELPDSLNLRGACVKTNYYQLCEALPAKESRIQRDGKAFKRYEVEFFYLGTWDNTLAVGAPHPANDLRLFLTASPGSAGGKGMFHLSFRFGEQAIPEESFAFAVLPPLTPLAAPSRRFAAGIPSTNGASTPFQDMGNIMVDFWKGLSDDAFAFRSHFNAEDPYLRRNLRCDYMIGCNKQLIVFALPEMAPDNREWRRLIAAGKVPALVDADGKASSNAVPAWYLLDDPGGKYEEYLAKGARAIRRLYPECRVVSFDYEPGADGFDPEGLKRFAKTTRLGSTPSLADVSTGKYRRQWFEYMIDLNHQYIKKVAAIFRREWPGVRFWLCTDNLRANAPQVAYWCAVDAIRAEEVVDGYMPMPYYCGSAFFDDIRFNLEKLRKPILPLADPSERSWRFFSNYTPLKLRQNIVAAAALGAKGYGFWPDDTLSGLYFQMIHDAWAHVAQAEEFYANGKRADSKVTIRIRNSREAKIKDAAGGMATINYPDYSRFLRSVVHEKDGELLLTVFNYQEANPLFLEISSPEMPPKAEVSEICGPLYDNADLKAGVLIKLGPSDVKLIRVGRVGKTAGTADQGQIKAELDELLKNTVGQNATAEMEKDGCAISWTVPKASGTPVLMLRNAAGKQLLLDALQNSEIVAWHKSVGQRFLGRIMLYDQSRIEAPYPFVMKATSIQGGIPSATFEYVFRAQDAAAFDLHGLTLTKKISLGKENDFTLTFSLGNPTKNPMATGFRVNNLPFAKTQEVVSGEISVTPGPAAAANYVFMRPGTETKFLPELKRGKWLGDTFAIKSPACELSMRADGFDGVYFWRDNSTVSIEPLTRDFILNPGETKTFTLRISMEALGTPHSN